MKGVQRLAFEIGQFYRHRRRQSLPGGEDAVVKRLSVAVGGAALLVEPGNGAACAFQKGNRIVEIETGVGGAVVKKASLPNPISSLQRV
jgi:hypothetical protein